MALVVVAAAVVVGGTVGSVGSVGGEDTCLGRKRLWCMLVLKTAVMKQERHLHAEKCMVAWFCAHSEHVRVCAYMHADGCLRDRIVHACMQGRGEGNCVTRNETRGRLDMDDLQPDIYELSSTQKPTHAHVRNPNIEYGESEVYSESSSESITMTSRSDPE